MNDIPNLGDLTLGVVPEVNEAQFQRQMDALGRRLGFKVKVEADASPAVLTLKEVRAELAALGVQGVKASREQGAAAQSLERQYRAAGEAGVQSARLAAAEAALSTAKIREQAAQVALNTRLANEQRRTEQDRSRQTISGIENEVRAYRNLWQSRVLSNDQVYAQQARLRQQALEMAVTVDKQSDAYRRLTQIAAAAQRTQDAAMGRNTPGGFGFGVSQGVTNALGQFGVTGDLITGFIELFTAKRAAAQGAASNLGRDAMAGLVQGMKSNQAQVRDVADLAGDSVSEAIRASLDIHSPSRVTEYLGKMAGLGFVTGMKSYQDEAKAAARALSSAAEGGLRNTSTSGGAFGGAAAANLDAGNLGASVTALAALNAQLIQAKAAGEGAAEGSEDATVAVEGLGESVGGAAEQVKGLRDAHNDQDAASRQAALNEAQTAIAFTATAAAVTAVAVALVASYNTAADYQKGMAGAKATTEATSEELARLDAVARSPQLVELGVGAKAAAAGIEELGSQGLSTADIVDGGLVVSLTLAKAVSTDVAKAAAVAASSTKAFGLEAKDLARIGSVVTNAVNATSIKMDNFSDAIAAGGDQAKRSGLNFTEFTAGISFLTDKAIGASDAGTSLKSFLMALTPNTKDAANEMKRLGFNAFDAQGNFKSLGEIAENLRTSFAKLSPEQAAVSAEMIFGSDGARVYGALVEQGNKGVQERIALLDRQGTMEEAARQKLEGARGAQEKLNAAIENFKITAGSMLLGPAAGLLDWATKFLVKIDAINQGLGGIKSPGEIKATLQIDWAKDDGTTIAYKLFAGGVQGTKELFGAAAEGLSQDFGRVITPIRGMVSGIVANLKASELQGELQRRRLIETPTTPGGASSQLREIQGNMSMYQGMLVQALNKSTQASEAILQSIGRGGLNAPNVLTGAGPLFPGQTRAETGEGSVSGLAAVGFMGLAGRNRGTPYGQTYGPGGSWGRHNGEDWFAPTGTEVKAAFSGYVSTRWSATTGHLLEMTDAKGQKLLLGHLDRYAAGLEQAVKAAGGRLLVQQGQLLAYVGQTGSLAHKDLGPGNAHVHVMGYDSRGRVVDPMSQNYAPVTGQGWTGGAGAAPAAVAKSFEDYRKEASRILAQIAKFAPDGTAPDGAKWRLATAQLEAFGKQNAVAADAVKYAYLEMGMASKEVSKYGQTFDRLKGQLNITESMDKLGQNVVPQLRAIQVEAQKAAAAELARNGRTEKYRELLGLAGDAASKLKAIENRKPDLTPLQQEQQRRAEQVKQEDMILKMRGKSAQQLQDIIKGGVIKEGDLDRIVAAQKELERREELSEKHRKEAQTKAAQVNEAIRQNDIAGARAALAELERQRDAGLQKVKGNLVAELAVQRQYADLVYNARKAVLDKEKKDRDADIRSSALPQGVKTVQLTTSKTIYDTALAEAAGDRLQRINTAITASAEASAQAQIDAQTRLNTSTIEGMRIRQQAADQAEAAAQAALDSAQDTGDRIVAGMVAVEQATLNMQATANKGIADDVVARASKLMADEDFGGALQVLQAGLERLMTAALNGEPAAEGIDALVQAFNNLTDARARWRAEEQRIAGVELALTDPLKPTPARVNGSIRDTAAPVPDGGAVDARRTRPAARLNPDGTEYVDPGVAARDPQGAQRAEDWEAVMRAERVDTYRKSLEKLDLSQLEAAKSAAILSKDTARYQMIQDQITRTTEKNAADQATAITQAAQEAENFRQAQLEGARADLEHEHSHNLISERTYLDRKQALDVAAAQAEYDAVKAAHGDLTTAGQVLQNKLTAIQREGSDARRALLISEAQAAVENFQLIAGSLSQLASAIGEGEEEYDRATGKKLQTPWKDVAANLDGAINAAGKLLEIGTDVMKLLANPADVGTWIKLATTIVSSIADAIAGFQKARAEVKRLKEEFAQDNPFLNADDYQKAFTRSRGFFADVFGGGPEVVNEIDKVGLHFAQTVQEGFANGMRNGLKEGLAKNDMSLFTKSLKEGVGSAILDGIVDSFVQGELLKGIIAPAIKSWSDAMKTTGDPTDDLVAREGLRTAVQQANALGQAFAKDALPLLQPLRDEGYFGDSTTSGPGSTFGSGPGASFGGIASVSIPQNVLDSMQQAIAIPAAAFGGHVDRFGGFVARLEALEMQGGGATPGYGIQSAFRRSR